MRIKIKNLNKKFGNFIALSDINIDIPQGELLALLGPSGCGKTTLLRIIAGLEYQDSGSIEIYEQNNGLNKKNNVGFVFQHYALFKHMTVFENISFGLKVKPKKVRLPKQIINEKVNSLLKMIQLEWAKDRYPHQLSGGQRQRVALARALAIEPEILLLDEPFGALDAKVRKDLRRWLKRLHNELKVTTIFVTHDQEEALELADRIIVMNNGKIMQEGKPDYVYKNPANPFVFSFLGSGNVIKFSDEELNPNKPENETIEYVRHHDIEIFEQNIGNDCHKAVIQNIFFLGSVIKFELAAMNNKDLIEVEIPNENFEMNGYRPGMEVFFKIKKFTTFN